MTLLLLGAGQGARTTVVSPTVQRTTIGIATLSLSTAGSYYVQPNGYATTTSTVLAYGQIQWPGSGTFRKMYVRLSSNLWTAGVQVYLVVNGSRTALTSGTIASGTLTASDLSNSVTVSNGDLVSVEVELKAGGSGSAVIRNCSFQFETEGQIFTVFASQNSNPSGAATASANYIRPIGGILTNYSTESLAYSYMLESCSLSNLQTYSPDTNAAALTIVNRKNNVDGSLTVTHPSATSGLVRDSTNSTSYVAGDNFTVLRKATGGATRQLALSSVKYTSTTANTTMLSSGGQLTTISAGATGYLPLLGGMTYNSFSSENNAAGTITCAGDLSQVSVYISNNGSSAALTMQLMKNGVATGNTQTISAGATGLFTITGTTSLVAGDLISVRITGTTTSTVTPSWCGALFLNTGA